MKRLLTALTTVAVAGCTGEVLNPGPIDPSLTRPGQTQPVCGATPSPGSAPMRRLSQDEYRNSLADVMPASVGPTVDTSAATFLPDPISLSYRNNANFLVVSPVLAQQYMDAAEAVAASAVADLTALLPCNPASGEAACADAFIKAFGRKLYRHALSVDDFTHLQAIYARARAAYDFKSGIEFVVAAMLQSPNFLYRVELDTAGGPAVRALTGVELASRLSYLVWQSGPDETLLATAERGELTTAADVEREAGRLLADPRAHRLSNFFEQWMDIDELSGMVRNATTFPGLDPQLPSLLLTESRTFVDAVVFDGDSKLGTLLTAPYTYLNQPLAKHYGYPGVTGAAFQKVSYPGVRGGLFMQGGVVAVHDKETRTSIVRRGLRIRTEVLCQIISAPPPNVNTDLGPVDQGLSQADRLAQHRTNPSCASCHSQMDPIGVGFEGIDAVGRDRAGVPTAGELTLAGDVTGPFADGHELVQKLADSPMVRECFVQQMYRFSMGRKEEPADACSRSRLDERFKNSGGDIRDSIVGLTQTDDFLFRAVTPP